MIFFGYDVEKRHDYENGFYLTSDITRLGKVITRYELYKMTKDLPGHIVECGVFKGVSFIQFATFRDIFESPYSRKIIGFDVFGRFPKTRFKPDRKYREEFIRQTGGKSISEGELKNVLKYKNIVNCELIKGDICKTVPKYIKENPDLKISLLHIDTDIYEPAKVILEYLYCKVVNRGVIVLDDYAYFPGETKAVDDFFAGKDVVINKFPFSHRIPSYIVKKG